MKDSDKDGQLGTAGGAPSFAKETGIPVDRQITPTQAPNTLDPAGGRGKQDGDGAKE